MNQILKKDYTLEKNYKLLSQQFGKLISFGRGSSSAERKSIRILNIVLIGKRVQILKG